jgi:flagellar motor switch protein FliM
MPSPQRQRYDFRQPQQVPRTHRDAARQVLESWAHWSATLLAADARQPVTLTLDDLDQHPYSALADAWGAEPMVWTLLEGATRAVFVAPRSVALQWFDWHIGGPGVVIDWPPDRELTEYEVRQWRHLLRPMLDGFRAPGSPLPCWTWRVGRVEFQVTLIAFAADADWVMAARFQITSQGHRAPCWLVWPLADFALDAGTAFRQQAPATAGQPSPALQAWLDRVPVRVTASVSGPSLTWRAVAQLRPDLQLVLPAQPDDPVTVSVAGVPKAHAMLGTHHGHRAIKLTTSWTTPVAPPVAEAAAHRPHP